MIFGVNLIVIAIVLGVLFLASSIKIIKEYERAVVFRLGRLIQPPKGPKGPGIIIIIPFIDRWVKVNLRLVAMDVPPQDIITKDNVSVKVNAVIFFRVIEPNKAITEVDDYFFATSQFAQTTLRSTLGQSDLDDLLSERERINAELQKVIDLHTDPWGIKVTAVEVKHVDLPQEMQRAIAKQAEAERERRAKVIRRGGRIPGGCEDRGGRAAHGKAPGCGPAPLPADPPGDRHGEQLHDALPYPHRSHGCFQKEVGSDEGAGIRIPRA